MKQLNNNTFDERSDKYELRAVIGDDKQVDPFAQVKLEKWNNEVNFSVRYKGRANSIVQKGNAVETKHGNEVARFYPTTAPERTKLKQIRWAYHGELTLNQAAAEYELMRTLSEGATREKLTIATYVIPDPAIIMYDYMPADYYMQVDENGYATDFNYENRSWHPNDVPIPSFDKLKVGRMYSPYNQANNPYFVDRGLWNIDIQYANNDPAGLHQAWIQAVTEIAQSQGFEIKQQGHKLYFKHNDRWVKFQSSALSNGVLATYINIDSTYNKAYDFYIPDKEKDVRDEFAYGLKQAGQVSDDFVKQVINRLAEILELPIENDPYKNEEIVKWQTIEQLHDDLEWTLNANRKDASWFSQNPVDGFEFEIDLPQKPLTNQLQFSIEHKGLTYFKQPQLTRDEILNGNLRNPNVVGSYAFYHQTKANNQYETGKAFHIYRPIVKDANGLSYFCDLDITGSNLTITIPQEFLDKAVYPITVDPTFGYSTNGASTRPMENVIRALTAIGAVGTLESISAYIDSSRDTNDNKFKFALYDASSGAKVAETSEQVDTSNVAASWRTLNTTSNPSLTAQSYWLAAWGDDGDATYSILNIYYDTLAATTFGRTTESGFFANSSADRKRVSLYAMSGTGIVVSGVTRCWVSAGSSTARMIIYSNNAGEPDALLAVSDDLAISNTSEEEKSFTFSGANQITLQDGVSYWLGIHWADPGAGNFIVSADITSDGNKNAADTFADGTAATFGTANNSTGLVDAWVNLNTALTKSQAYAASWPDPLTSITTTTDRYSIYASYSLSANDTRAVKITGQDTDNDTRAAKITGIAAATEVNDERDAKTTGTATANNTRSAKIIGQAAANDTRSAKIIGIDKLETLQDDFNDNSLDATKWSEWNPGDVSETNQQLEIESELAATYKGMESLNLFNLEDSYAHVRVVQVGSGLTDYGVFLQVFLDANNTLSLYVYDGSFEAEKNVGGIHTVIDTVTYDPNIHKWWRIRESGGTVFWEHSANGINWTELASDSSTFDVSRVKASLFIGTDSVNASTDTAIFDNFNITPISSERAAKITGNDTANSERDAKITGQDTVSNTRNAKITGTATANATRNAKITGTDTDNNERSAKIIGQIATSNTRNAKITGSDTASSERSAKIVGGIDVSSERNSKITGQATANAERAAKITGQDSANDERNAKVTGTDTADSERAAKVTGKATANDERDAKISGVTGATDQRSAKITGTDTANDERSAKTTGSVDVNDERNAKIVGTDTAFDIRSAKITGQDTANAERNAKITGVTGAFDSRNAKIIGTDNANDQRSAKITGQLSTNDQRNAKIIGTATASDIRNAKVVGTDTDSSERNAKIIGSVNVVSERDAKITGQAEANNQRAAKITGSINVNDQRNAKIAGAVDVTSERSAKIEGADNRQVSERNARIVGVSVGEAIDIVLHSSVNEIELEVSDLIVNAVLKASDGQIELDAQANEFDLKSSEDVTIEIG